MKKVSIVIPVYNVEKYIGECLDSIINQTYKNLEIILVDDESKDKSGIICDEYALKDSRIKVVHKKNGGAASARNVALDLLTGDYIAFIDSDDYVASQYIEYLVQYLEQNNADISICSYYDLYTDNMIQYDLANKTFTKKQYLENFLGDWTSGILWNKLFKKELLEHVRFIEGRRIDDEFFTYKGVLNSECVIQFNIPLIYYRQRISSVMQNENNKALILRDRMDYMIQRYKDVTSLYPELKKSYYSNLLDTFIHIRREINTNELKKQFHEYLFFILKEYKKSSVTLKEVFIFLYNILFIKKIIIKQNTLNNLFE